MAVRSPAGGAGGGPGPSPTRHRTRRTSGTSPGGPPRLSSSAATWHELLPGLEAGSAEALADGFVTSAAVLRHLQADPLLPVELLPPAWPGEALRADYDRYDAAYRSVLRAWFAAAR